MKVAARWWHIAAGIFMPLMLLMASTVHAKSILVLTTSESAGDGIAINNNCIAEFLNWAAADPANRRTVVKAGSLNNAANPLTMNDLVQNPTSDPTQNPPTQTPYDIIATCTVYNKTLTGTAALINEAMRTRVARTFLLFDEAASFEAGWINAKTNWQISRNPSKRGESGVNQQLNTQSMWAASPAASATRFDSMLPVLGGHSYGLYKGVPVNNALYTPSNLPPAADSSIVDTASLMVIPLFESYMDATGMAQGACIFVSTDVSMFDSVRYPSSLGNAGKIARTFIEAAEPGGACSPLPTVAKTFSPSVITPGGTAQLTIALKNNGGYTDSAGVYHPATDVTGVNLTDVLPAPLQFVPGSASVAPGCSAVAAIGAAPLGEITVTGSIPPAGCSITAQVTWPADSTSVSQCTNTSTNNVTNRIAYGVQFTSDIGPLPSVQPATGHSPYDAVDNLLCQEAPVPVLSVTKTALVNGSASNIVKAGDAVSFDVVISNSTAVAATGVQVADAQTTDWNTYNWTCSSTVGSSTTPCAIASGTGAINASNVTVPGNGSVTYRISTNATGATPSALNSATVTPGATGGVCSDGNAQCTANVRLGVIGQVAVTKALTGAPQHSPAWLGDTAVYTVKVSNPSSTVPVVNPITVTDPLPQGVASGTWSCLGNCGAVTSGSLPLNHVLPGLLPGASATYTINVTITTSASNVPANQVITNTATIAPSGVEVCQSNICEASNADVVVAWGGAQVSMDKALLDVSAPFQVARGQLLTYAITVKNPSDHSATANAVWVNDDPHSTSPGLLNPGGTWACESGCTGGGSLPLNQSFGALAAGASFVIHVQTTVSSTAPHGSIIANSAGITTADPDICAAPGCTSAAQNVTVYVAGVVDITKKLVGTATQFKPGDSIQYIVEVSNPAQGPINNAVTVADTLSSIFDAGTWTCAGACGTMTTGNMPLNVQLPTLAAGAKATYTISTKISSTAAHGAAISNTATATPTAPELCSNGQATCSADAAGATVNIPGTVQIAKSLTSAATAKPGDAVTYQIIVSNSATGPVTQPITVADTLPAGLDGGAWTCAGACGAETSGVMPLNTQIATLEAGATATFTVTTKVSATAADNSSIVNTASITPTAPELCGTGQASCSAESTPLTVSSPVKPNVTPVPTLNQWALLLLSVLILMSAGLLRQRLAAAKP